MQVLRNFSLIAVIWDAANLRIAYAYVLYVYFTVLGAFEGNLRDGPASLEAK